MIKVDKLDELLSLNVGIYSEETNEKIDTVKIWEIVDGFSFSIELENNKFYLVDNQDESDREEIGETIESALLSLGSYREYFNNYGDEEDSWYSDFIEYNEKYLTK